MTVSLLVMIVDRVTSSISTLIGEIICGDSYMCAVDGIVGDCSCGFNTDMSSKRVKLEE